MTERRGLWIDVEFCTGCKACEMACRQEHGLGSDEHGIKVFEQILNGAHTFNYVPVPTDLCNLCQHRDGEPACVHHCMASVMREGPLTSLLAALEERPGSVLWTVRDGEKRTGGKPGDDVFAGTGADAHEFEAG